MLICIYDETVSLYNQTSASHGSGQSMLGLSSCATAVALGNNVTKDGLRPVMHKWFFSDLYDGQTYTCE